MKHHHIILLLFFSILFLNDFILSLRLTEVRIPNHTVRNSTARLECHFDMDGEDLYSVKWYKDGHEFYRYIPRSMPPALVFELPGINVDIHNSTDNIVVLKSVNLSSTGRYRCEVSAEAPSFETVSDHGDMIVVVLPEIGPKISGGRPRYQIGDEVNVNCTSGRSKPATHLTWFINSEPADPSLLKYYNIFITGREGLETTTLGLNFKVNRNSFRHGNMKLKCLASIATVYWKSNEESVEGDRLQRSQVIRSRESTYAGSSRADRVRAANNSFAAKPSSAFIILISTISLFTKCYTFTYY
ncbi:uncharacterized protein LOC129565858 isoform X2 [Sitodiplosis mosellana]|uniref:uncharacterized protein LOC129565858 isoform X2 n=1 Tax=Sitodiplosis mosellana TaxID=263140 RepID=UPI002443FF88|nr:uncharacterized protein LOC129565858 isoform X2 [Sitodiplosis mosellana]